MCHITGFQKILDINYTRIGLSINVKFSLGKLLGTRQKNYSKVVHKRYKITPEAIECVTKSIITVSAENYPDLIPCTIQSLQKLCLNFLRTILDTSSNGVVLGQNSRHTAGIIS